MATFFPPRNSEGSIDGLSEPTGVSSTILFWEQQAQKEKEKEDQQQREGEHKEEEEEEEKEKEKKEKEKDRTDRAKQEVLGFLSMLVLVAMLRVVWCSISEPPFLVWRLSFLLCFSCIIWSRQLDVTVSFFTMFLVPSFGFVTALYVDAVLDHEIGVLLAHLTSHLAAGMLGYALARHRQHHGLEVTPATALPPEELSEKEERKDFYALILGCCYMVIITALCAACMAWVLWYRAEYPTEYLILHMFGPMCFLLMLWSLFLGVVLLRGVFIGERGLGLVIVLLVSVLLLFLVSWIFLGDVCAMLVTSLGFHLWTGWFGYSVCVYNSLRREESGARKAAKDD